MSKTNWHNNLVTAQQDNLVMEHITLTENQVITESAKVEEITLETTNNVVSIHDAYLRRLNTNWSADLEGLNHV